MKRLEPRPSPWRDASNSLHQLRFPDKETMPYEGAMVNCSSMRLMMLVLIRPARPGNPPPPSNPSPEQAQRAKGRIASCPACALTPAVVVDDQRSADSDQVASFDDPSCLPLPHTESMVEYGPNRAVAWPAPSA